MYSLLPLLALVALFYAKSYEELTWLTGSCIYFEFFKHDEQQTN